MTEKEFWLTIRQGILQVVGAIERKFNIRPLTAELRREAKQAAMEQEAVEEAGDAIQQ